jgi:hypothetical protein
MRCVAVAASDPHSLLAPCTPRLAIHIRGDATAAVAGAMKRSHRPTAAAATSSVVAAAGADTRLAVDAEQGRQQAAPTSTARSGGWLTELLRCWQSVRSSLSSSSPLFARSLARSPTCCVAFEFEVLGVR